jgi:Protein of unknown function (DUF2510)/Excalibur calcium-binding domain
MSQGTWGPDPYGRHQLRYWNGQHWTEHVANDGAPGLDPPGVEGPLRGEDADNGWPVQPTLPPAPTHTPERAPTRIGPRLHALLTVLTLGLWLLILPSLMLWRRGWHRGSMVAGAGAAALLIAGMTSGTGNPPQPEAQSLVGQAAATTQPTASQRPAPAATTTSPVKTAAPTPAASTTSSRPPAKSTAPKTTQPAPKKTSTTKKPSTKPTTKKTTAPPAQPADRNCSDFSTHAQAQAWFEKYYPYYGDFANLDADGDGSACESLP